MLPLKMLLVLYVTLLTGDLLEINNECNTLLAFTRRRIGGYLKAARLF